MTLTISHKEPELRVSRKTISNGRESTNDAIFYTDGRGETNLSRLRSTIVIGVPNQDDLKKSSELKSKTKWEGGKVVSRSSTPQDVMGNRFFLEITEARELSSDGRKLTIVTTFLPGRSTVSEVFDRVQ